MSPHAALVSTSPQRCIVIEQRDCSTGERYVVVLVSAARIDRTEIPDCDGKHGVCRQSGVVDRKSKPLIPYSAVLKVLVWRLGVDGEGFGIGEWLDGHVELGIGTEVAASMPEVRPFKQG